MKKQVSKTSIGRPKEVDANGNLIKRQRVKRAPRPVEEVSIYFRVISVAERLREQQLDAGFDPTPPQSEDEGEEQNAADG